MSESCCPVRRHGRWRRALSPQGKGRLARPWGEQSHRSSVDAVVKAFDSPLDEPVVNAVQRIAEARGASMAQVALAWVLKSPPSSPQPSSERPSPITCRTRSQHWTCTSPTTRSMHLKSRTRPTGPPGSDELPHVDPALVTAHHHAPCGWVPTSPLSPRIRRNHADRTPLAAMHRRGRTTPTRAPSPCSRGGAPRTGWSLRRRRWDSNPPPRCTIPRGPGREDVVTSGFFVPVVSAHAHQKTQQFPMPCGPTTDRATR